MTPFDPDVPETVCLGAEVRLSCFDQVWARAEVVGLGHEVTIDTLGQAIADAVTATGQATGTWNAGTQEVEFAFSDAFFEQIGCCTFTVSISHYVGSRLGGCPESAVPEENLEFDVSVSYPVGNAVVDCCRDVVPDETVIDVDPEPGCCWEPTWLYQQRHRMFTWLNQRTVRSILETWKRIGYGMGEEMEKNVRTAKELHRLALYLYSVLYRIQCYGGTWRNYVTETEIRCWLDRFFCLGVDVRCLFQMTGIGDFVDCCDPPVLPTLCPCTVDDVPDNLPTESFVFDVNDGDQGVNLSAPIEYRCCDGSTEACITKVQAPAPAVTGVRLDVTQWCQADGYSFDLDFNSTTAVAGQSGDYVVTWLICGREVRKIVRVRVVDTCRNRFPNSLPIIYKTFDKNIPVPFDEYDATVDIENFECCGPDGETVVILSITPPSVGAGLGVQYEYPSPGDVINGSSVGFNFIFHPADATAGARGDFKVRMRLCGEREIEQIFRFDVVDTCVPTDLQDPGITPVTLTEGDSGQLFTAEVPLTDVNCCTGGNDIVTVVNVVPPIERISGIRVLSPTTGQTYVAPSGVIRVEWLFDTAIAPDFTPGSYTITVQVRSCGGRIVNIPIRMDIAVPPPCGSVTQGGTGQASNDFSTGTAGQVIVAYDLFGTADPLQLYAGIGGTRTLVQQTENPPGTPASVSHSGYVAGVTPVNQASVDVSNSNWCYKLFCVDTVPYEEGAVVGLTPEFLGYGLSGAPANGTYAYMDAVLVAARPVAGRVRIDFEVDLNSPTPWAATEGPGNGVGYLITAFAIPPGVSINKNTVAMGNASVLETGAIAVLGDEAASTWYTAGSVAGTLASNPETGFLEVWTNPGDRVLVVVSASRNRTSGGAGSDANIRPVGYTAPAASSIVPGDTVTLTLSYP